MNLRNLLFCTAAVVTLLMAGSLPADAGTLPIGSYSGPVQLNFDNFEDFLTPGGAVDPLGPQVGDQNVGLFAVTSITVPGLAGQTLWTSGQGGIVLAGVFDGVTVQTVSGPVTSEQTTNTGGVFKLYSVASSQFLGDLGIAGYAAAGGGCTLGGLCYHGITDQSSSSLALTMTLTPGIDGPGVTLTASLNATLDPPTGTAAFDGLISDNTQLGSQVFGKDSFCPNNAVNCAGHDDSTFQLASQDPIIGTAIPEPASMAVLGTGLLALGAWRSRRKMKADPRP